MRGIDLRDLDPFGIRRRRYSKYRRLIAPFRTVLRSTIESVVMSAGFQWNEGALGASGTELRALFEAADREFIPAFPQFFSENTTYAPGCIDLWIRFDLSTKLIEADLEGWDVNRWLRDNDHVDLAEEMARPDELEPAVWHLAEGLQLMLSPPPL
jgi:hypothetical protein